MLLNLLLLLLLPPQLSLCGLVCTEQYALTVGWSTNAFLAAGTAASAAVAREMLSSKHHPVKYVYKKKEEEKHEDPDCKCECTIETKEEKIEKKGHHVYKSTKYQRKKETKHYKKSECEVKGYYIKCR